MRGWPLGVGAVLGVLWVVVVVRRSNRRLRKDLGYGTVGQTGTLSDGAER